MSWKGFKSSSSSSASSITAKFPALQRLAPPVHVSHRGGASLYGPANTMYNYKRSVYKENTHVLEIDLHLSADGHLVLMHNQTVNATTNGTGRVQDMTLEELKQLDAAYFYTPDNGKTYPLRGKGITVPTLQEVLKEFVIKKDVREDSDNDKHDTDIVLAKKERDTSNLVFLFDFKAMAAIPPTLQLIEELQLHDRVIVGAVAPAMNKHLRKVKPANIACAADINSMLEMASLYALGLLWLYPFKHEVVGFFIDDRTDKLLTEGLFNALHRRGHWIAVFGPALNHSMFQKKYLDRKTHLIVTDHPHILNETLKTHSSSKEQRQTLLSYS